MAFGSGGTFEGGFQTGLGLARMQADQAFRERESMLEEEWRRKQHLIAAGGLAIRQAEEQRAAQEARAAKIKATLEEQKDQHRRFGYTADVLNQVGKAAGKARGLAPEDIPQWKPTDEDGGYDVTIGGQTMRINPRREFDEVNRAKAAQYAAAIGVDPRSQGLLGAAPTPMPTWARTRELQMGTSGPYDAATRTAIRAGILPPDDPEALRVPYEEIKDPSVAAYKRGLDVGAGTAVPDKLVDDMLRARAASMLAAQKGEQQKEQLSLRFSYKSNVPKGKGPLDYKKGMDIINGLRDDAVKLENQLAGQGYRVSVDKAGKKTVVDKAGTPLPPDAQMEFRSTISRIKRDEAETRRRMGLKTDEPGETPQAAPKSAAPSAAPTKKVVRVLTKGGKKYNQYADGSITEQ